MSQAIIRKAFESRLKTWADALTPAMPIAWQNVAFDPPTGRYARAFVLPGDTQAGTLERTGRDFGGLFQVTLLTKIGTGSGAAEVLAASLDAAFPHTFEQDGLRIWLTRPFSAAPAVVDGDRYAVPVTAAYAASTR